MHDKDTKSTCMACSCPCDAHKEHTHKDDESQHEEKNVCMACSCQCDEHKEHVHK